MTETATIPVRPRKVLDVPTPMREPEVAPLTRVLEAIRADSLKQPGTYLDETEVLDGGE